MSITYTKPDLVAPGGNYEKARLALLYGADAVYLAGPHFGLRKSADNLSYTQLEQIIGYARSIHKKIYVVLNCYAHSKDMDQAPQYLDLLERLQPHALIISDLGLLTCAKSMTTIPIHVSTQASVTNWRTAKLWKDHGAKRVVVSRECQLPECTTIKEKAQLEVETFIHGAMCASYSGKCTISNYTAGRDSNRGGCIQSCRHTFDIIDPTSSKHEFSTHIMNAKDLMGLSLLPSVLQHSIDALKIEGRMKSLFYLANAVSVYRLAIDMTYNALVEGRDPSLPDDFNDRLSRVSNRSFSTGGLQERLDGESINYTWNGYEKSVSFIGTIKHVDSSGRCYALLKAPLSSGDTVILHGNNHTEKSFTLKTFFNIEGSPLNTAHPNHMIVFEPPQVSTDYRLLLKDHS